MFDYSPVEKINISAIIFQPINLSKYFNLNGVRLIVIGSHKGSMLYNKK